MGHFEYNQSWEGPVFVMILATCQHYYLLLLLKASACRKYAHFAMTYICISKRCFKFYNVTSYILNSNKYKNNKILNSHILLIVLTTQG